jgi:hypothetical protein
MFYVKYFSCILVEDRSLLSAHVFSLIVTLVFPAIIIHSETLQR